MRQPSILALTSTDDAKALAALAAPLLGSSHHLFLAHPEGDSLVVPLGEKVALDGTKGLYTVAMLMPHSDWKGGCEHGPAVAAKLTAASAAEATKAAADKTDPSLLGPWSLSEFVAKFPLAEKGLEKRLLDEDGVLRAPLVFMGDDPYQLVGTEPKTKKE